MIQKEPIFIDFGDKRRRVVFNLNTEIVIRSVGKEKASLWKTIGEHIGADGEKLRTLDVDLENLRVYLWAALQEDANRRDEILTLEDVGALIGRRVLVIKAMDAIAAALKQYYGDEPGEA